MLAFPSIIAQGSVPHCAVILDLTRVHGSRHSGILPQHLTLSQLIDCVQPRLWCDIEAETLEVWIGDATHPACRSGALNLAQGIVIEFVQVPHRRSTPFPVHSLFEPDAEWTRLDHVLQPPRAQSLALCYGLEIATVRPAFFFGATPEQIALKVYKLDPTSTRTIVVDNEPTFDLHGDACTRTVLAIPDRQSSEDDDGQGTWQQSYFLDLRALGIPPRLVHFWSFIPDLPDMLQAADVELPIGWTGIALDNRVVGPVQILTVGLTRDLATLVFPGSDSCTRPVPDCSSASAVPRGPASGGTSPYTPGRPGRDRPGEVPDAGPHVPTHAIAQPPTAHDVLLLQEPEEPEPVDVCVLVFAPRFKQEDLVVSLTLPCEVDDLLHAVSGVRQTDMTDPSVYFDHLIPPDPQPDVAFASVIALPAWEATATCCLIDTRLVDGRLFAMVFASPLKPTSILLHLGLPYDSGFQVFVANRRLQEPERLYDLELGDLITILPPHTDLERKVNLDLLLTRIDGWAVACPQHGGHDPSLFCILTEAGLKCLHIDADRVLTSADFKAATTQAYHFTYDRVTICPSVPRLCNVSVVGRDCQAVLVATENISRLPVPPAKPTQRQHVVFVDCRLLFVDIQWLLAPQGLLCLVEAARQLGVTAPVGYALQLRGGTTEQRHGQEYLRVDHGEVLVLLCLPDTGSSPSSRATLELDSGSTDQEDSSSESPDSDSGPPAPKGPPPPRPVNRSRSPSRSRSRHRNPPPTDSGTFQLSLAKLGIELGQTLAGSGQWSFPAVYAHKLGGFATVLPRRRSFSLLFAEASCCLADFPSCQLSSTSAKWSQQLRHAVVPHDTVASTPGLTTNPPKRFRQGLRRALQAYGHAPEPGCPLVCKLLHAQAHLTLTEARHLQQLRRITLALGDDWPIQFGDGPFDELQVPAGELSDDEIVSDTVRLVGCAGILTGMHGPCQQG